MIQVLIVEDERPISSLIRLALTKEGYACTCAYDGAEAADLLENNPYDLVLLDVMLPHVDGFELMEYIRPLEIPVIFITAVEMAARFGVKTFYNINSSLQLFFCHTKHID